jgi:hypothetical protein
MLESSASLSPTVTQGSDSVLRVNPHHTFALGVYVRDEGEFPEATIARVRAASVEELDRWAERVLTASSRSQRSPWLPTGTRVRRSLRDRWDSMDFAEASICQLH